jgi:hypothetical protein
MIRVLHFADIVNRCDFIESIVRWADPNKFEMSVCVRSKECNIAPLYSRAQSSTYCTAPEERKSRAQCGGWHPCCVAEKILNRKDAPVLLFEQSSEAMATLCCRPEHVTAFLSDLRADYKITYLGQRTGDTFCINVLATPASRAQEVEV